MGWFRSLVVVLVLLVQALTFNAYACLVPVFPDSTMDMGVDCSSQHSKSAREYCDTFKVVAIKAPPSAEKSITVPTEAVLHLGASALFPARAVCCDRPWQYPLGYFPSDASSTSPPLRI